ncbi:MAG: DUF4296 domain-containing protein [Alistipes sp.]|nr:DUF4296 domain-containing protein [Alistipes sp.]
MKLYRYIIAAFALAMSAVGCSGPKVIPDNDLINIIHDAYIANAYMNECNIREDSLYVYEPIFQRYGYTMTDMQYTLRTFNERKSAMLSDIMSEVYRRLDAESDIEAAKMVVLDTIDNIAKRTYTRTIYADSLIRAKRMKDTTKLRITIEDLVPGEYTVSFTYLIDTLDENRNSRVEAYALRNDSTQSLRHTLMLSRYREGKYSRKFSIDTSHKELFINMFYHPMNEESALPDITITNFKVVRVLPLEVSVDSLYQHQLNLQIINHRLMTGFTADTVRIVEPEIIAPDSTEYNEEKDSLALRVD